MSEKPSFIRALSAVAVHFEKTMTPELAQSYEFALAEYSEDDLVAACRKLIRGKFFPRAYDFILFFEPATEDVNALATLRWGEVEAHLWHGKPLPDDPHIQAGLNACGDLYCIRHGSEDDRRYFPARFIKAYCGSFESNLKNPELMAGPVLEMIKGSDIGKLPVDTDV